MTRLYMLQFAYTPEAWTAFTKNPEDRTPVIQGLAQKMGCRFEALYYGFGEYDGFVISGSPGRRPRQLRSRWRQLRPVTCALPRRPC